tara:strand:+ start:1246 stop:1590 length:345 start_codon:yes stop_codon:yes gene_type:complete
LIIKKTDINSIFPIIIKIIKLNFEDVNKLAKLTFPTSYIEDVVVLVIVKIDSLNDFSKSILSNRRIPERINKLIKNDIKIKKEIFMTSSVIFLSELKIFLFTTLLGLTNLIISE